MFLIPWFVSPRTNKTKAQANNEGLITSGLPVNAKNIFVTGGSNENAAIFFVLLGLI
jgi:hypothetical protein